VFMQPPSDLQVIKFQLDVNHGSSKQDTDFHILFLSKSESMIHCFFTCLYIVLVNGTIAQDLFLQNLCLHLSHVMFFAKVPQMAVLYSRENILTSSNYLFCMSHNR